MRRFILLCALALVLVLFTPRPALADAVAEPSPASVYGTLDPAYSEKEMTAEELREASIMGAAYAKREDAKKAAKKAAKEAAKDVAKETTAADSNTDAPFLFGLLSEECFARLTDLRMLQEMDAATVACAKKFVSKGLSLGIVAGSAALKAPQILNIVRYASVDGLSENSLVMEFTAYALGVVYNVRSDYPLLQYGEYVIILAQCLVILLMFYGYRPPSVGGLLLRVCAVGGAIAGAYYVLPIEHKAYILLVNMYLGLGSRVPQIWSNLRQGHTGPLSSATLFLNVAGAAARVFTTMQVRAVCV
jgi:mannose-P-dolichol utilization defect protein 1